VTTEENQLSVAQTVFQISWKLTQKAVAELGIS